MSEQHLDLFAFSAADCELFGVGKISGSLPGVFVHMAGEVWAGAMVQALRIGQEPQVEVSAL